MIGNIGLQRKDVRRKTGQLGPTQAQDAELPLDKLEAHEPGIWERLAPGNALSQPVNYGRYGM